MVVKSICEKMPLMLDVIICLFAAGVKTDTLTTEEFIVLSETTAHWSNNIQATHMKEES